MAATLPAGHIRLGHQPSHKIPSNLELLRFQTLRDHSCTGTFSTFSMQLYNLLPQRITLGIRFGAAMDPVVKRATGNAKSTAKLISRIKA